MSYGATPVVLKCASPECGTRYPSPRDDSRLGTCPHCEGPSVIVESYDDPVDHRSDATAEVRLAAIVDNVRSAMNVGTILRTADGVRIDHVYLCGITAAADNPKVAKAALGADRTVASSWHPDATQCVTDLRADGFAIWALEATVDSISIATLNQAPPKLALIVGNERAGVDPELLRLADRHVHLGMGGIKTSLNVGVAFGAAAYWLQALPAG